jgi:hypothetical protein
VADYSRAHVDEDECGGCKKALLVGRGAAGVSMRMRKVIPSRIRMQVVVEAYYE